MTAATRRASLMIWPHSLSSKFEQVESSVAGDEAGEWTFVGGLDEFVAKLAMTGGPSIG
jgi:hypothetical protein